MFFIGYVLFEVPSNMLLRRYGAHRWLARIMVSWGLVSAGMMFVQTPMQFYIMRFLLGMAEAGFFPGVIFYLTGWFTREHRGRMTAAFMTAIAVAGVVVGPVSGAVLHHFHELGGYAGWQWLFLIEGVPSVLLGLATLYCLPVSPERARWLTPQEAGRLNALLQAEREGSTTRRCARHYAARASGSCRASMPATACPSSASCSGCPPSSSPPASRIRCPSA